MLGLSMSVIATGVLILVAGVLLYNRLVQICQPNEVLILSGRGERSRIIKGGRTMRIPLLETVDRLDLTNMAINVSVKGAYAKGGIPLNVQGVANIKVAGTEPTIHHAMERLLGKSPQGHHEARPGTPWRVTSAACWRPSPLSR